MTCRHVFLALHIWSSFLVAVRHCKRGNCVLVNQNYLSIFIASEFMSISSKYSSTNKIAIGTTCEKIQECLLRLQVTRFRDVMGQLNNFVTEYKVSLSLNIQQLN